MTTTRRGSRGALHVLAAASAVLVACLLGASPARAQWATSGDNISNTNTGNVGVGTTSPATKLHVAGQADNLFYVSSTGSAPTDTVASFASAVGHILTVRGNGNVGVGTTGPNQKLSVVGTGAFYNTTPVQPSGVRGLFMGNFSMGSGIWSYDYVNGVGDPLNVSAQEIKLNTYISGNGVTRLHITNAGEVGVGTSAPAHRLDVAGNVNGAALCIAGDCKTAWSQVGGGTTSQWTTSGSNIFYGGGNVGVGTSAPGSKLFVGAGTPAVATLPGLNVALGGNSYVAASNGTVNTFLGADATTPYGMVGTLSNHPLGLRANNTLAVTVLPGGNVGVGTSNPVGKLTVAGGADTAVLIGDRGMAGSVGLQFLGSGYKHAGLRFDGDNLVFENASSSHIPSNWHISGQAMNFIVRNGSVGIGKTNPTAALDVVGDIKATGSVSATYQDVAEWVPSTQRLAAGTVVVLDAGRNNHVLASTESYDTRVAGVVSAQPGVILGTGGEGKLMVATTGRVKVKVDATRAPVRIGDLLVTGEVEGVAMKSEPIVVGGRKIHAPGTIIGKALEPLEKGVGEILVLLSLQ